MKFDPMVVGLYTGLLLVAWHAVWALMVLLGWAKPLLDFVFGLHFLTNPYVVKPFSWGNALMLIVFVFVVWFVLGYVATLAWNKMQKGR
jgi:hypothetical protein